MPPKRKRNELGYSLIPSSLQNVKQAHLQKNSSTILHAQDKKFKEVGEQWEVILLFDSQNDPGKNMKI